MGDDEEQQQQRRQPCVRRDPPRVSTRLRHPQAKPEQQHFEPATPLPPSPPLPNPPSSSRRLHHPQPRNQDPSSLPAPALVLHPSTFHSFDSRRSDYHDRQSFPLPSPPEHNRRNGDDLVRRTKEDGSDTPLSTSTRHHSGSSNSRTRTRLRRRRVPTTGSILPVDPGSLHVQNRRVLGRPSTQPQHPNRSNVRNPTATLLLLASSTEILKLSSLVRVQLVFVVVVVGSPSSRTSSSFAPLSQDARSCERNG